jgi:hypothetical protein
MAEGLVLQHVPLVTIQVALKQSTCQSQGDLETEARSFPKTSGRHR